jgi:MoxR-like ATPase
MAKSETVGESAARAADVSATIVKIVGNVEKVIIGKRQQLVQALVAYLCEGHILLEDVPGVAKTMLARALARSVGCTFKRIQCTPDLLPTDVTGVSVFNQKSAEFEFRPGPIFAQTVLADEINRATPRTQAALLEAMAERRVTVDGKTYNLEPPFLVIATQNPIDPEGTFPLPEAQLDRPIDDLRPVVPAAEFLACQEAVREIYVDPRVRKYILEIVAATRQHDDLHLGGSPRASIALFRTGQAYAAIGGRNFVLPDDVKKMAHAVLSHRLILRPESRLRKVTATSVVQEILTEVPVPMMDRRDDAVDHFQ